MSMTIWTGLSRLLAGVLVVLVLAAALIFWRVPARRADLRKMRFNETIAANVRSACQVYVVDHNGHYPRQFSGLDEYVDLSQFFNNVDRGSSTRVLKGWSYFGAGFTQENPPLVSIAAPAVVVRHPFLPFSSRKWRVFVDGRDHVRTEEEAAVQTLIAETNRQIESLHPSGKSGAPMPER